jgi:uncharacterized protein
MTSAGRIVRTHRAVASRLSKPLKIVVTGPFNAGKTTLIRTISEVAIVGTERDVTDETKSVKESTTVAMDFGRITFDDDACLFLFGTPGQRRFEVMWEILSEGMIGFIVLVNAADGRSVDEAAHILDTFREYADVPYVIGVTHLDEAVEGVGDIMEHVRSRLDAPEHVRVVPCDVRKRDDVKALILDTLYGVMGRLEAAAATSSVT